MFCCLVLIDKLLSCCVTRCFVQCFDMESAPSTSRRRRRSCPFKEIVSPRMKRKKSHFSECEKIMIIDVFKYVKDSWPADKYASKHEMKEKTANILGISKTAVYRVLKEYIETDTVKPALLKGRPSIIDKIDDCDKSRIRRIVHSFQLKGEVPTVRKVLHVMNADESLPNMGLTSLAKLLKHLKGASEAGTSTPQQTDIFSDQESLAEDSEHDDDDDDDQDLSSSAAPVAAPAPAPAPHVFAPVSLSRAPSLLDLLRRGNQGDQPSAQQAERLGNHVGIICNSCYGEIHGFRYSCVECVNFDLCARCEAMREHDHHYMLRVPGPRPAAEVKGMMADIRAALQNRPEPKFDVEVKYEPRSDDEDNKPIDPLKEPVEKTKPDGSSLGQNLLNVGTRTIEDPQGQPAPSIMGRIPEISVLAAPSSASHPMLAQYRQPIMIINPLVAKTVRTQAQSPAHSKGKLKAVTEKRKSTSDQIERVMVPLPFKMPKEEPLDTDSGDTGDPTDPASKEADFRVFTIKNKRDDDEEFDSGAS